MAEQDEIVEIMARAAHDAVPYRPAWEAAYDYERNIFRHEARATLSALTAAGCEVVQWRPIAEAPTDGTYVAGRMMSGHLAFMQFCADGYWRTRVDDVASAWEPTHFCILRGPQGGTP